MCHALISRSPAVLSVALLIAFVAGGIGLSRRGQSVPARSFQPSNIQRVSQPEKWSDRLGDGFPDGARLSNEQDRRAFVRWLTYLAETQYYQPSSAAKDEIDDCAALIRFSFRNALAAHTPAWRRSINLASDPGFQDIASLSYPTWPLGRNLFRVQPGPLAPTDLENGAFAEFADAETLFRFNSFFVSRNIHAARPGDLIFYHQPGQSQPYHSMIFLGTSYYQSRGTEWIVYHTGDLNGRRGEIREVEAGLLMKHPDPHWRPLEANPRFLGVYRFEILR